MTLVFIFKNGATLEVECESAKVRTSNITGKIIGYQIEGITSNKPLYTDVDEIVCIYQK